MVVLIHWIVVRVVALLLFLVLTLVMTALLIALVSRIIKYSCTTILDSSRYFD